MTYNRLATPRLLSDLLAKTLQTLGLKGEFELREIQQAWHQVVGEAATIYAKPTKFDNGNLIVEVTSPVWSVELGYLKDEICCRLNSLLTKVSVIDIHFMARRDNA